MNDGRVVIVTGGAGGIGRATVARDIRAKRDIAEASRWLASDKAAFVHGAVLSVDGGLALGT